MLPCGVCVLRWSALNRSTSVIDFFDDPHPDAATPIMTETTSRIHIRDIPGPLIETMEPIPRQIALPLFAAIDPAIHVML